MVRKSGLPAAASDRSSDGGERTDTTDATPLSQ